MFQEITNLKEIKDSGKHVVMCHYPIPFFRASFASTAFMLYGHVHQTIEYEYIAKLRREVKANSTGYGTPNGNFINVGCMMPYIRPPLQMCGRSLETGGYQPRKA